MYKLQQYERFFQRENLENLLKEYPIYCVIEHTKDNIILNKPWEDDIIVPQTFMLAPESIEVCLWKTIKVFGTILERTTERRYIDPVKYPRGSIIITTYEEKFSMFLGIMYNWGYMNKAIQKIMEIHNIKDFRVPYSIVECEGDPYNMEDFDWFSVRN